jgi:hypothetical protein
LGNLKLAEIFGLHYTIGKQCTYASGVWKAVKGNIKRYAVATGEKNNVAFIKNVLL